MTEPREQINLKLVDYNSGDIYASVSITDLGDGSCSIHVGVLADEGLKMFQRGADYPETNLNNLGLVFLALTKLPKEAFVGKRRPSGVEWGLKGVMSEIQGGSGKRRNHRSAFWRRQSLEHGDDE